MKERRFLPVFPGIIRRLHNCRHVVPFWRQMLHVRQRKDCQWSAAHVEKEEKTGSEIQFYIAHSVDDILFSMFKEISANVIFKLLLRYFSTFLQRQQTLKPSVPFLQVLHLTVLNFIQVMIFPQQWCTAGDARLSKCLSKSHITASQQIKIHVKITVHHEKNTELNTFRAKVVNHQSIKYPLQLTITESQKGKKKTI